MSEYILSSYDQKKILYEAKVLDGLQYLQSSIKKLNMAHLELCSLRNIVKNIKESYQEWNKELFSKGSISDFPTCNLDYFSNVISDNFALDKVTIDFFNYIHSLFDTYAQFINVTLLANEALDKNKFYLKNLYEYLTARNLYPEITSEIEKYLNDSQFEFIEDYNNITKHQSIISNDTKLYLNNGDLQLGIPGFEKVKNKRIRTYSYSELESKMLESYEFARSFCVTITNMIYQTLSTTPHLFNQNRIHSVHTRVQMPNPNKGIQGVIEVSLTIDKPINQNEAFYVLLANDSGEKIITFNCPYKSIVLKDTTGNIIGMLVAEIPMDYDDTEVKLVFTEYRKYLVKTENYHRELIEHLTKTEKATFGYGTGEIVYINNDMDEK